LSYGARDLKSEKKRQGGLSKRTQRNLVPRRAQKSPSQNLMIPLRPDIAAKKNDGWQASSNDGKEGPNPFWEAWKDLSRSKRRGGVGGGGGGIAGNGP